MVDSNNQRFLNAISSNHCKYLEIGRIFMSFFFFCRCPLFCLAEKIEVFVPKAYQILECFFFSSATEVISVNGHYQNARLANPKHRNEKERVPVPCVGASRRTFPLGLGPRAAGSHRMRRRNLTEFEPSVSVLSRSPPIPSPSVIHGF